MHEGRFPIQITVRLPPADYLLRLRPVRPVPSARGATPGQHERELLAL